MTGWAHAGPEWLMRLSAYAIGTLAMYWTIERVSVF
jgi:hypothetical protein